MSCTVCGAHNPIPEGLCRHCGAPLAGGRPTEPPKAGWGQGTLDMEAFDGEGAIASGTSEQPLVACVTGIDAGVTAAPVDFHLSKEGPLESGQSFGPRYKIVRLLGVGGMGAVYEAWDSELAITVALKVVRPEVAADPAAARQMEQRFKRELLLARQVTHKNVVRIHDLGEIDGIKYITMSFIEGEDLATILHREGRLPVPRALRIMRAVLSGLVAAHQAGVVHRDLKPANVMIRADDEALIMDFGIARSAGRAGADGPTGGDASGFSLSPVMAAGTQVGKVVGTLEYMAPEQAKGASVDQRADIYSFGLICYDMLAGRPPAASGTDALADLMSRMKQAPAATRSLNPAVPEALDRIVTKCLQPDADARYLKSADLAVDLARLDAEGKPLPVLRRVTRRLVAVVGGLVLLLLATTWFLARTPPLPKAHDPVSVLIADVENATGDKVFDGAVEETLARAIEGASFIDVYPRATAAKLARKLKPGAGLDEATGRLVARSEGIHVLMTGSVGRQGTGFVISVRAVDPAADGAEKKPLAVVTATAATKEKALQAVGTLGARIRGPLGDTTPESARLAAAETFTTSSAEAVKTYTLAQDLLFAGRTAEALDAYKRAILQDPGFGRAYSGAGIAAQRLGRDVDAQDFWKKALSTMERMTEREKYRTLGGYYLNVARNYQKAIENYRTLVNAFPADRAGHASLALAYFWALDLPKALEEEKRALELDPKSVLVRVNYALYAMYAGDFETAAKETQRVIEQQPTLDLAYVPLATAALARGNSAGAIEAYGAMARTGASGASLAATGLADVALYEGRFGDVEKILRPAIAEDETGGNLVGVSAKWVVLAEAYEGQGRTAAAVAAARKALALAKGQPLHVLAAAVLIRAGQEREAKATAAAFSQQLEAQSRAYGKILEGRSALKDRRFADAVDAFTAAQKLADLWMARFDLGVAYIEAGHFAEGLAELERCQKRRGEATALFLDEVPTFRYLAPLSYWLARAQEGVGQQAAATSGFNGFLSLRKTAPNDPLAVDATRRLSGR